MTNSIEKIFTGSGIDVQCGEEYASVARIVKLRGENTGKYAIIKVAGMSQEEIWDATTEAENNGKINTQKSLYLAEKYAELVADAVINELCALEAFAEAAFDYLPTTPTITIPADNDTMIFKTKYTRRRNGKPESFVGYELSINGNEKVTFPKGTTLPQIRKAYPQHADAVVVVMPNHILKGINTAECEEIKTVVVKKNYTTTPADVTIEAATAEEQAEDLAVEPEKTIYTVESERPKAQPAKTEPTLEEWIAQAEVKTTAAKPKADHQEAIHDNSDHARRIAGETPATAHARYELADVKDWATLQEWIAANPKHCLARKMDGAKAVEFAEYNDGVVCIVLDNKKEAYPYYRVLPRYFDVVPM